MAEPELLFSLGAALCSRSLYLIRSINGNQCDVLCAEVGLCSWVRHQRSARLILVPLLLANPKDYFLFFSPCSSGELSLRTCISVSHPTFLALPVTVMGLKAGVMSRWHRAAVQDQPVTLGTRSGTAWRATWFLHLFPCKSALRGSAG